VLTGRISARPEEAAKQRGDRKRMRALVALQQGAAHKESMK